LIKGLEILTVQNLPVPPSPPGAPSYRNLKSELVELNNELTRCLKLFSDSVSYGEKLIRDANNDLKTETFNYLVSFLMSFSSRTATRDRLHIFTTNYDRIIETGAEIAGLRLIDRFVGTIAPIFREAAIKWSAAPDMTPQTVLYRRPVAQFSNFQPKIVSSWLILALFQANFLISGRSRLCPYQLVNSNQVRQGE